MHRKRENRPPDYIGKLSFHVRTWANVGFAVLLSGVPGGQYFCPWQLGSIHPNKYNRPVPVKRQ